MIEYENNSSTNNNNSENNIAPSIATLTINFHISFSHERNRIIKSTLCHLLNIWKLWASSRFHWISKENSLFIRSKKSGEVTLRLDSKPISVFCQMGDFGCGDGEWTPTMKINGNKVKINLRINSLLIQDSGKKRQRGWAKSAGFPWKTSRVARLSSLSGSLEQTFTDILLKIRKQKSYLYIYMSISEYIPLRFPVLEEQECLQPSRRQDWLWLTRDKVTDKLDHILLQDRSWYEDRQSAQIYSHQQAGRLSPLPHRWWEIPQHLIGP